MKYLANTIKGLERDHNEDRVIINGTVLSHGKINGKTNKTLVAVICDGVGGTSGGEVAAEMAASSFLDFCVSKTSPLYVTSYLNRVNRDITEAQKSHPTYSDMATTIAGAVIVGEIFLLFNMGDARIYEVRKGAIIQKSRDHVVVCEDFFSGDKREAITSYLGGDGHACFPSVRRDIISKDTEGFFICSDGIYKFVSDAELLHLLVGKKDMEEKRKAILQRALQNGSKDDISFIYVDITD